MRPGITFFDDGDQPNALATPDVMIPDEPDGTILFGVNLLQQAMQRVLPEKDNFGLASWMILAHEFGHIVQYKAGMSPEGPWQMEPHADFLAGWFLGAMGMSDTQEFRKQHGLTSPPPAFDELLEGSVKTFFDMGDIFFNDRTHHGEPEFRAAMVRSGYDAHDLEVTKAFEKGKKMAGLI